LAGRCVQAKEVPRSLAKPTYNIPVPGQGVGVKSSSWSMVFLLCLIAGILLGYFITLVYRPGLIPPMLRLGGLTVPETVLLLGTDVVYGREKRALKADPSAFTGRSDTILVARFDPLGNTVTAVSIPRDTQASIPRHGRQKINAANALGGPGLAVAALEDLLGVRIDHYVVLNVQGLVEVVDELGGIMVVIPKRMQYVDRSAGLKIDLAPGPHHLSG
jgi:LCP family protein required for cell wall assembly